MEYVKKSTVINSKVAEKKKKKQSFPTAVHGSNQNSVRSLPKKGIPK
jgi:hypothetical protein